MRINSKKEEVVEVKEEPKKMELPELPPLPPQVPQYVPQQIQQYQKPQLTQIVQENEQKELKKPNLWDRLFNKRRLRKPRKIAVLYLKRNGTAETLEREPKKNMFEIDGKTYHEEKDCIYTMSKDRIPLAVIYEGGIIPEGNAQFWENLQTTKDFEERCERHQELVLKAIRHAELVRLGERDGPKISPKVVIGVIVLIIVVVFVAREFL